MLKEFWMGVPNRLLKDNGSKLFFIYKMEYEMFDDGVKLSSALVPMTNNDRSLKRILVFRSD